MNRNINAPICLFVYNRLWHTIQTIEALGKNSLAPESDIFIFSDGAKNNTDIKAVSDLRAYIQTIKGFNRIHITLRDKNLGLADNIISGVTEIVGYYKQVIVVEDDLITSPYFLQFMNDGLNLYRDEERVASIHGYVYPTKNLPETFFLRGADCWGWATWDRAWNNFEPDGTRLLNEIKRRKLEREINYNNSTNYMKMLRKQIKGKNNSWAIRWHLSALLKDKLTLYPGKSLIKNIGNDNSGQHSIETSIFDPIMLENYVDLKKIDIIENLEAKRKIELYFKKTNKNILIKGFNHFAFKLKTLLRNSQLKSGCKKILKNSFPPFIFSFINNAFNKKWHGNYNSWQDAQSKTTGYDSNLIINKVYESLYKVKMGISVYERDSVLFDKIEYSWPLLTGLMMAAAKSNGKIHVLDFGGSLGSTFFQNKKILDHFIDVRWNIVEQENFVRLGKKDFEDDRLKFYYTVNECLELQSPNVLILASVLQYLERPYVFLESLLIQLKVDYILIDRTPFGEGKEKIVAQTVPSSIYKASYPCHIFNLDKLKFFISRNGYDLVEEFETLDGKSNGITFKGLIYLRNNS